VGNLYKIVEVVDCLLASLVFWFPLITLIFADFFLRLSARGAGNLYKIVEAVGLFTRFACFFWFPLITLIFFCAYLRNLRETYMEL
jgi:hypothetical protein